MADEGWEGYDGDGAKNDMPPKKLYVPKTAPDFFSTTSSRSYTPIKTKFSHLFDRKLFYRTVYSE